MKIPGIFPHRNFPSPLSAELRRQIFRQIVQQRRRLADAKQGVSLQDGGKIASEAMLKALAANYAVLP